MSGTIIAVVTFLISAAVSIPTGMYIRKKSAESKIKSAENEAKRILSSAKKDAENAKKEEILKAKESEKPLSVVMFDVNNISKIKSPTERFLQMICDTILDAMGKDESSIKYVEDRLGHDRRYAISNDKITAELGWKPSLTFEEGIKLTIDWYLRNQDWMKSIEEKKASLV